MQAEQSISLRQEQTLINPAHGRNRVSPKEARGDVRRARTQKDGELVNLLKYLCSSKFFGELLIKYESGKIVLVEKTQYVWLPAQHRE